ncbi:unnamed protein product [Mucor fragilis]
MRSRKRATRVRIVIKRAEPWTGSIRSKAAAPHEQKHTSPSNNPLGDTSENDMLLNIKQEQDSKNEKLNKFLLKQANSSRAIETSDAHILPKDMAKKNNLVAREKLNSNKNYCYYCSQCKVEFDNYISARNHRKTAHHTKDYICSIKDMYLEPDYHDPNNYCQSCENTYPSRQLYCNHMRYAHYIRARQKQAEPSKDVAPDPNFLCQSCNMSYGNRQSFREHRKLIHNTRVSRKNQERPHSA